MNKRNREMEDDLSLRPCIAGAPRVHERALERVGAIAPAARRPVNIAEVVPGARQRRFVTLRLEHGDRTRRGLEERGANALLALARAAHCEPLQLCEQVQRLVARGRGDLRGLLKQALGFGELGALDQGIAELDQHRNSTRIAGRKQRRRP